VLALIRPLFVPLILVLLCWFAAARWLGHGSKGIDANDLLVWFVFIPALLLGIWFVARRALRREDAAAPTEAAASQDVAPAQVESPPAVRPVPLLVTAARLQSAAGASTSDLLGALAAGTSLAQPDATLIDNQGLPMLAAPVSQLDLAHYESWVSGWVQAHPDAQDRHELLVRSLALAADPALGCLDSLCQETLDASGEGATKPRKVQLMLQAPRPVAFALEDYLREQLLAHWGAELPLDLIAGPVQRTSSEDVLRIAGAFGTEPASERADALLIVACDTLYNEDAGLSLASRQASPHLGEAAAAIVLQTTAPVGAEVLARLEAPTYGRRPQAPDQRGAAPDSASRLLTECLGERVAPDAVHSVVSDCDHRAAWFVEAARAMTERLPQLDPVKDHLALGRVLGHTGMAASALALAVAAAQVQEQQSPVVHAVLGHDFEQSFALLTPYTPDTESSTVHTADS